MPIKGRIALVGGHYSRADVLANGSFSGTTGTMLEGFCKVVGIDYSSCLKTSVFKQAPPKGSMKNVLLNTKDAIVSGDNTTTPFKIGAGLFYVPKSWLFKDEKNIFDILKKEICDFDPSIILTFGDVATWALTKYNLVGNVRGYVSYSKLFTNHQYKTIATYDLLSVIKNWKFKDIVLADLIKTKRNAESEFLLYPKNNIKVAETVFDCQYIFQNLREAKEIAFDIEGYNVPTCISFCADGETSYVIPILTLAGKIYWNDDDLPRALRWIKKILALPAHKITHSGLYDITHLWNDFKFPVKNPLHDTILLHHALNPEMEKSLNMLGSLYLDVALWKDLRNRSKAET